MTTFFQVFELWKFIQIVGKFHHWSQQSIPKLFLGKGMIVEDDRSNLFFGEFFIVRRCEFLIVWHPYHQGRIRSWFWIRNHHFKKKTPASCSLIFGWGMSVGYRSQQGRFISLSFPFSVSDCWISGFVLDLSWWFGGGWWFTLFGEFSEDRNLRTRFQSSGVNSTCQAWFSAVHVVKT